MSQFSLEHHGPCLWWLLKPELPPIYWFYCLDSTFVTVLIPFYGLILQLISFFPWFFRIICCLVNYIWTLRLFQILLHLTLTFITKCNFSMRLVVLGEKYLVSMTYFAIKIRTHEKRIWQHSLSQTKVDNAESFVALRCKVANRIVEEYRWG